jgi:alpha-mannosidase
MTLDIIEWHGLDAVELRVRLHWQEKRCGLKLEIPTALKNPVSYTRMPGDLAQRPMDGCEEPMSAWLGLEGTIGTTPWTLGVVTPDGGSYDCLKGQLRLTLLRTPHYAEHFPTSADPDNPWLDQGRQERKVFLVWKNQRFHAMNLPRESLELTSPAQTMLDGPHEGARPRSGESLHIEGKGVELLSVKPAEKGNGIIVRLQELTGKTRSVQLHLPGNKTQRISLDPWEIATLHGQKIKRGILWKKADMLS